MKDDIKRGHWSASRPQLQNLPKCRVILFPLIWHAADIAFIERETGRTAIGREGYIELVVK